MENRILIIDDDYAVLEILTEWLTEDGFAVKAMAKVENILTVVKNYRPDLILLDYQLQGTNGGELCLQLKNNRVFAHIPVAIFSAFQESVLVPELFKCNLFIQKPFDLYELVDKMKALLVNPNEVYRMELN